MTERGPDRLDEKLFVTDDELIRRIGGSSFKLTQAVLRRLDQPPTDFPQKQKLFGNTRYWPAVKAYFDQLYGLDSEIGAARLITERPDRNGPPRRHLAEPKRRGILHDGLSTAGRR